MSSAPSTSVASDSIPVNDIKQLKNALRLDLKPDLTTLKGLSPNCTTPADLLNFLKTSTTLADLEKITAEATPLSTPTIANLMNPKDVSLAQRNYAQGFIDALKQIHQLHKFMPTPVVNSPLVPQFLNGLGTPTSTEASNLVKSPISPSRDSSISVIMAMSMGNMYSFPPLSAPLPYSVAQPTMVPSTSTVSGVNLPIKTEPIRPPSTNVKESYYEMYPTDSTNDTETCSSARSNASPQSQDEGALLLNPFSGDRCLDIEDQEKKKLERKRARNRAAATKCRQRKIQKINDLEKEVHEQEAIRADKNRKLDELEAMIGKLRHIVQEHQAQGCSIIGGGAK